MVQGGSVKVFGSSLFSRDDSTTMTSRVVVCLFDAQLDEWWTCSEPAAELELRLVLNWLAMLNGDGSTVVPLRFFQN